MECDELGNVAELSRKTLEQGIPQGSTLGPILFNLFMSPPGSICQAHELTFVGYIDDTQNYMCFRPLTNLPEPQLTCISKLESCLADVRSWMLVASSKSMSPKPSLSSLVPDNN